MVRTCSAQGGGTVTVGATNEQVAGAEATAFWPVDDLGPEKVVFLRLPLGCTATVVVDNTALGAASAARG